MAGQHEPQVVVLHGGQGLVEPVHGLQERPAHRHHRGSAQVVAHEQHRVRIFHRTEVLGGGGVAHALVHHADPGGVVDHVGPGILLDGSAQVLELVGREPVVVVQEGHPVGVRLPPAAVARGVGAGGLLVAQQREPARQARQRIGADRRLRTVVHDHDPVRGVGLRADAGQRPAQRVDPVVAGDDDRDARLHMTIMAQARRPCAAQRSSCRAMTTRWIWFVPS